MPLRNEPKLNVRRYCPRESMLKPARPDGPVRVVTRRAKRSDGFDIEPCPKCNYEGVEVLNMDMQDVVGVRPRRYRCTRCGHRWGG